MYKNAPLFSVFGNRFNIIILAAGLGSRLRPATDYIPKALVEVGGMRGIDHAIRKYQYVAERIIIATGYCADLLENYVRGGYPALHFFFSQENVQELRGPGKSLLHALDFATSRLPTLITFCDYLLGDEFSVDQDGLAVCRARPGDSILGTYKTVAQVDEGVVLDLMENPDIENRRENGFTGIAICHNTLLLKSIVYGQASAHGTDHLDYAFSVIRPYIQKVRTLACPIQNILEFGTEETLQQTRRLVGDGADS